MRLRLAMCAMACAAMGSASHLAAQVDSAVYIVRIGVDTTAVERWVRTADSLHVVSVTRSPRTIVRRYVVRFDASGRVVSANSEPQGAPPTMTNGAVPIAGGTYAPYAVAVWQAARADAGRAGAAPTVRMLAGRSARDVAVARAAVNEYTLPNQFDARLVVRLNEAGNVTFIDGGGGATVERVPYFDIERLTAEFTARDAAGTGLGVLSPRDTAAARVSGGSILIDYSRPSARGRTVMGELVPYGAVWRTGANNATTITTDVTLRIGDLRVEPGSYSLFTIPGESTWELIVNRQTGMSGLDYDPSQDVGRVTMHPGPSSSHTEQFTIALEPDGGVTQARGVSGGGMYIVIRWGQADVAVPIATER